jgi:hypothetical protein
MKKMLLASFAACLLAVATISHGYAQADGSQPKPPSHREEIRGALLDARLAGFRAGLRLTTAQEANWSTFEATVRNIAKAREERLREMREQWRDADERPSPVERMRFVSNRLASRSADLKALADAATPLYASLDDEQKQIFGALFRQFLREGRRHHHHDEN